MFNLIKNNFQAHPFHLVSHSPWPLFTKLSFFKALANNFMNILVRTVAENFTTLSLLLIILGLLIRFPIYQILIITNLSYLIPFVGALIATFISYTRDKLDLKMYNFKKFILVFIVSFVILSLIKEIIENIKGLDWDFCLISLAWFNVSFPINLFKHIEISFSEKEKQIIEKKDFLKDLNIISEIKNNKGVVKMNNNSYPNNDQEYIQQNYVYTGENPVPVIENNLPLTMEPTRTNPFSQLDDLPGWNVYNQTNYYIQQNNFSQENYSPQINSLDNNNSMQINYQDNNNLPVQLYTYPQSNIQNNNNLPVQTNYYPQTNYQNNVNFNKTNESNQWNTSSQSFGPFQLFGSLRGNTPPQRISAFIPPQRILPSATSQGNSSSPEEMFFERKLPMRTNLPPQGYYLEDGNVNRRNIIIMSEASKERLYTSQVSGIAHQINIGGYMHVSIRGDYSVIVKHDLDNPRYETEYIISCNPDKRDMYLLFKSELVRLENKTARNPYIHQGMKQWVKDHLTSELKKQIDKPEMEYWNALNNINPRLKRELKNSRVEGMKLLIVYNSLKNQSATNANVAITVFKDQTLLIAEEAGWNT